MSYAGVWEGEGRNATISSDSGSQPVGLPQHLGNNLICVRTFLLSHNEKEASDWLASSG